MILVKYQQQEKAYSPIEVSPVKYCNSSNEVIVLLFLNTVPRFVTAAASALLNSTSPFVSQFWTQRALTLGSTKEIIVLSGLPDSTVTEQLALRLVPSVVVTVMVAEPGDFAVTSPLLLTVATDVLLDFHVTVLLVALVGSTVAVN